MRPACIDMYQMPLETRHEPLKKRREFHFVDSNSHMAPMYETGSRCSFGVNSIVKDWKFGFSPYLDLSVVISRRITDIFLRLLDSFKMYKALTMGWGTVLLVVLYASGSIARPQNIPSSPSPSVEQQQHQPATDSIVAEHMVQSTQFSLMPIPGKGTIGVFIRSSVSINGFQFQLAQNDKIVPVTKCSGGIVDIMVWKMLWEIFASTLIF